MSATVTYKGSMLTTVENETKKLSTAGTWLEDDITIEDVTSGGVNKWVRPADWPDIESLVPFGTAAFSSFDGVYLTFDNTGNYAPWAKFQATTSSGKYVVERGHILNGSFVSDYSVSVSSSSNTVAENYSSCGYDYPIYYIHTEDPSSHLTWVAFRTLETSETGLPSRLYGTEEACIECVGHIAYCGPCGGNGSNQLNGNKFIVHEHLVFGDKIVLTSLQNAFNCMTSLEEIDFSGFNTSDWEITNMSSMFRSCSSLKHLDFSTFDMSNWEVTYLSGCFYYCTSLQELDLSSWDTSKWNVSTMNECFYGCSSIKTLNLSSWDTSKWELTTITSCFVKMMSLETLDLSGWDTSHFSLTSLNSTFDNTNRNLRTVKISAIPYSGTTNISYPSSETLEDYYPMSLSGNQNYSACPLLTPASLRRIISSLPNGNYKLSLGRANLCKLTSAEIAVATDKGWTVS